MKNYYPEDYKGIDIASSSESNNGKFAEREVFEKLINLFKNDPDFFDGNRNDPTGLALSYLLPKTSNFSPLQFHLWKKN